MQRWSQGHKWQSQGQGQGQGQGESQTMSHRWLVSTGEVAGRLFLFQSALSRGYMWNKIISAAEIVREYFKIIISATMNMLENIRELQ